MEREKVLNIISDALWLAENVEKLPNCNNCLMKNTCKYVPKPGEMSRFNCYAHIWESEK